MDPFDTGYINWRKFVINQARVLPVPSVEYIVSLRQAFMNLPSYQNGKVIVTWIKIYNILLIL